MQNILTSQELLEQQLNQKSTKREIKPKPVELSKGTGIQYNATLKKLVREIKRDVNQLLPLLRDLAPEYQADSVTMVTDSYVNDITSALRQLVDKWTSPAFRDIATRLSSQFVRSADRVNAERFGKSMGGVGIDLFGDDQTLIDYIDASIFDNTRLIMSIPEQYLTQVESIVMTNVRQGNRPAAIAKSLQKQFNVTENRAKMIARDQTAKINSNLSQKRQVASGFQYFQWLTSEDERVRDRHDDISDKVTMYGHGVYRWDNLPMSSQGVPIAPGTDYQCRCTARPVSDREVKENQEKGLTRPGVKR